MKGYRKILIAVNGAKNVLAEGLKLAGDEQCWVTVVKVIPPNEGDLNLTGIKNIEDVLDSGGNRAISEFQNIAKGEKMLIKTRLEEGKTHEKIIEVAEEEKCDLIILGAQKKKNRLLKIFGGNTIEKIIQETPCPVLVVKQ